MFFVHAKVKREGISQELPKTEKSHQFAKMVSLIASKYPNAKTIHLVINMDIPLKVGRSFQ